jgi:hypothetical protein
VFGARLHDPRRRAELGPGLDHDDALLPVRRIEMPREPRNTRRPRITPGIAPLLGPWRLGAAQVVLQRKGGFDPAQQLDFLSRHEVTNVFTTPTAMRPMMAGPAQALAALVLAGSKRPMKVLDVSASHGAFGLAFATTNPAARVVGLDWPNVLEVTKENARAAAELQDKLQKIVSVL